METFEPGDVIDGKYKITKLLGRGGMGLVVAATQPGLDTLVALKVLLPELRDKPEVAARFAREARAADRLRSEHVARVYAVSTTPAGTPFIVMEHLDGDDLAVVLKARGRLELAEAVEYLLQACEAIAEAHGHGIVHRDLKPGNLFLITAVGGLPSVKVLDFGISKASFPDDVVTTDTSAFFGSPLYMSPEQLVRPKAVDARSDVWALGIILYELLAGCTPFTGDTVPAVCAAILGGKFAKLSTHRADIPPELDALVSEALAPSQESRLPSVEAFAKKLAPFGKDGARRSYERIARLAGGATHPTLPRAQMEVALLGETANPFSSSLAPLSKTDHSVLGAPAGKTENDVAKVDAPPPATKKASAARVPALLGLAGLTIAGAVFGFSRLHPDSPATTASSSTPGSEAIPSASAVMAAAPSASAESPTAAGSAPSAPAPIVLADPIAAPKVAAAKAGDECAKGATHACEAACAAHAPGRCEALAKALAKGNGAPKDITRAEKLYQAECDTGAGSACNSLGALFAIGTEVTKDNAQAITLYKRGCDLDNRAACVNLGAMHFEGTGVPKNPVLGVTFFSRACPTSGPVEPNGCLNLSIAYAQGLGVPKDPSQAVSYAKQACDHGLGVGCTRVSTAKLTGDGVPKDVRGAIGELDSACTRGEASACKQLVTVYSKGLGDEVPRDDARYRDYLDKACKAHDVRSCQLRGLVQKNDSFETNVALSTGQLETSCNAGVLGDCGFLGERAVAGQGMPADRARGIALLDRACKGGVARACQKLAEAQR
jgi:serine/threonine protein kinase/TPR repeat protein